MLDGLSIVVPVYNSQDSLPILLERLGALLPTLVPRFEVILVNDGSRDLSGAVIDRECATREWLVGVHLLRNFGQHNALLCGIRQARYETIVTMDDDLQNPPEEIPRLLAKIEEGYDVVYGYPKRESHGFLRDFASRITKLTLKAAMGVSVAERVSSFRAFRSRIRSAFADYRGAFVQVDVLMSWGTSSFCAIPVPNPPRTIGVSTYTVKKLILHAMNMITGFSTLPLQFASILGLLFAALGFFNLVYVLGAYFVRGAEVRGFSFLASVLSIFSGVQLFSLGIMGEYLARMHFRLLDRPSYAIRVINRSEAVEKAAE
jgi:undecaprenyl-phosphate 4-deoxy-4-formamido-L-arabinose transferase